MFKLFKSKALAIFAAALAAFAVAPPALASGGGGGVDVSGVVSAINDAVGPIGQIGAAVLLVLVAIKVYKWVRRAM